MKRKIIVNFALAGFISVITTMNAQNTFPVVANSLVGIGLTAPTNNLQLHGTATYSQTIPAGRDGSPSASINYGISTRLGFTTTTSGSTALDGLVMRYSVKDFFMKNWEEGNVSFNTGLANLQINGTNDRFWFGSPQTSSALHAYLNVSSADNGIYIKPSSNKYGLTVQTAATTTANAIQVLSSAGARNFTVNAQGFVFARKYTTTLAAIPDYVFAKDYKLMPLSELRTFLDKEKHLPNIPSATEYEKTGVDLGELNRLLLEKVEEAHLYILQLETRLKALEKKK